MPDYFTLAELRALPDISGNEEKYPTVRCEAVAAYIVSVIEREVGTSFVTRTIEDEPHDGGGSIIFLHEPYTQALLSVTEDGVTTEGASLRSGILRKASETEVFAPGFSNIAVTYEAGYSATPPADVKEMALKGTRAHLMATASNSAINDRVSSMTNGDQGTTSFVMAGVERPTGYPEVDAMILGWKKRLHVSKVY